ncbi:MAG TPA: hypothetical protein VGM07_13625 [Stellaceae bacterium]|jgi:hypothetical protein
MTRMLAAIVALLVSAAPVWAGAGSKCAATVLALWGDGRHDDTAALNAWFRGDNVVWAQSGRSIGSQIGGGAAGDRVFRLSGRIYIPSGTGRRIAQFEFVWPRRRERVSGGTIVAGLDPAKPPGATNLREIGAGPGEGVPFPTADPKPDNRAAATACLVS